MIMVTSIYLKENYNAISNSGDLLIAISTSGNFLQYSKGFKRQAKKKIFQFSFLGKLAVKLKIYQTLK